MVRGQKRPVSESKSGTNLEIITSKRSRINYGGRSGCRDSGSSTSSEYDGDDDTDNSLSQLGQSHVKPVVILRLDVFTVASLRGSADMSQSTSTIRYQSRQSQRTARGNTNLAESLAPGLKSASLSTSQPKYRQENRVRLPTDALRNHRGRSPMAQRRNCRLLSPAPRLA